MDYQNILNAIYVEIANNKQRGHVATYIPELSKVDPSKFGISLQCVNGDYFSVGDTQDGISIQSISKIFALSLALRLIGEEVWQRVDVEPSGDPFNSLIQLEHENGIPRNPCINAGAIVIADILMSELDDPKDVILSFVRKLAGNDAIQFNEKVAQSEADCGFRNAALANFLKSFGNLHNPVEKVLDLYFHMCAIEMNCQDLSKAFLVYANHGELITPKECILTRTQAKRINAIMQTCGFYDEAGEFAFRVGLAGKSGVGGAIAAIQPKQFSVTVWSPGLNAKGNSVIGMKALELLTTKTGISIF